MSQEVLTYNAVPMSIIGTKEISRRHVMSDDNTTYLWTKWIFDVRTVINNKTLGTLYESLRNWLAQQQPAGAPGLPSAIQNNPALVDAVLRKLLNVPRKGLVFS